jgi:hypothetical protein
LYGNRWRWHVGSPWLLLLASFHLLSVLTVVEAQLGVLVGLQVWLLIQARRFFLCANLCGHKMNAQSGLDGRFSPWLGLGCLAWTGYPVAAKLCEGHDPVAHSI